LHSDMTRSRAGGQDRLVPWREAAVVLLLALLTLPAFAVGTQFWTSATYEDFARGNFKSVSLGREGSMTLSPALEQVLDTEQALIWAVARDSRDNIFLGTGHSGKVFRLGPDLKGSLVFDAAEPDVFALAVDKDDRLYVATSPDGKIYRVDASGQSSEFFDPKTKYIWSMTFAPDGALYVGTGDRGRIFRVRADGAGDVFYETHQAHIMSLAVTPQGELIAGTEPNGLLYKISGEGKAFVLYDSPLAEIHQVSLGPDGSVYAATLGTGDARPLRQAPQQPSGSPVPVQAATTITVRASDDLLQVPGPQGGAEDQPNQPQQDPSGSAAVAIGAAQRVAATTPRSQQGGPSRSAIVRVHPDSTVETLWTSPAENAFDLTPSGGRLLFSTDEKGRIYELANERELSLLTQTDQEQTTRLIPMRNFVLVTTANLGKVFRLGADPAAGGSFESDVRDAGNLASWGQIRWEADLPPGTSLELFTRSGNSARPDSTWSDWSAAYRNPRGEAITSPPARYAQWKAELRSANKLSPVLREVTLAYLPRNRAPEITEIKAVSRADRQAQSGAGGAGMITSGGGGAAANRGLAGMASAGRSNLQRGVDISWLASDPDQDQITYQLYFRGEGESEWKLLQEDLEQNYFQLSPESLPDGSYRVKVVASDAAQNPASTAHTAERVSAPFIVDYTPPAVEVENVARSGPGATVRLRARDGASVLTRAEYALDAQPLQAWLSDDGIVDSREETFTIRLSSLDPQEHLLTLRIYDSTGNVGVAKAVLPALGGAAGGGPARGQAGAP
jgi:outer membrane protein assembly factor BamB